MKASEKVADNDICRSHYLNFINAGERVENIKGE